MTRHMREAMAMNTSAPRGIALVIVLSVLTVLALLATSLAVLCHIEYRSSQAQIANLKNDLLLLSAAEHAKAALYIAKSVAGSARERSSRVAQGPRVAQGEQLLKNCLNNGSWIDIHDSRGALIGRYLLRVEDEAAKVNVNTAWLLGKSKGSGWHTGEISLPSTLGLPRSVIQRMIDFRYGPNRVPGARGDDDNNHLRLMTDGIDNNANGIIDEAGEGVDDPGEFTPLNPFGDDRAFCSTREVINVVSAGAKNARASALANLRRELPRRATLYSVDMPGSPTLPNDQPADVNAVTAKECRRRLRKANAILPFERAAAGLDVLAANIVDYRDENHVLSTLGAEYGVEAVCFNELLANDGTVGKPITCSLGINKDNMNVNKLINDHNFMVATPSLFRDDMYTMEYYDLANQKYSNPFFNQTARNRAWDVKIDAGQANSVLLLGPSKLYTGAGGFQDAWCEADCRVLDKYVEMRKDIGQYGPRAIDDINPGFPAMPPSYVNFDWPPNFFKNSYVCLACCEPDTLKQEVAVLPKAVKILFSDRKGKLTLDKSLDLPDAASNLVTRCIIWGWQAANDAKCSEPNVAMRYTFQGLLKRKYYLPVVNGWSDDQTPDRMSRMGFAPYGKLWGDNREHINRKWEYGGAGRDATPVRTSNRGYLDVYVRSGNNASYKKGVDYSYATVNFGMTFVRPEVMELINVSPRSVSLRNWTLTFNSGSVANDIGMIKTATGGALQGAKADGNPSIRPNGYFYLVNNVALFNTEFGSGAPRSSWGNNADENIPVWEIPSDSWGVQYRITDANQVGDDHIRIALKGERFKRNEFMGEVFEALALLNPKRPCAHGTRYQITENGRNWIQFAMHGASYSQEHFRPDVNGTSGRGGIDTAMILGMPAKGGVVSMTLKNEYMQVAARTITYGHLDSDPPVWWGRSAEKIDPTHYNWTVRRIPSIGGKASKAINRSMRGSGHPSVFVKNGPFASVAELQRVRAGDDFENVGGGQKKGGRRRLASLVNVFGSSCVRLEAADNSCERIGWKSAMDEVASVGFGSITADRGGWENGQWKGHTLRFMTGPLCGESFPVSDNTKNILTLTDSRTSAMPRSTPGRVALRPQKGDVFSIGPGYNSASCYARRSNESGEWKWRKKIPIPGDYDLYIFGLNDAINTTEFLEENHNASVDVAVWNYSTGEYNELCSRKKYGKEDCFHAGMITPERVSPDGDIKLRLTAHDVVETGLRGNRETGGAVAARRRQTGYAWFNYALITPVPVAGRVNINTAGERLLAGLPGIDAKLAKNIRLGVGGDKRKSVKPYSKLGDLLKVKGMTEAIFERTANLLTVDSDTYTFEARVQTIRDVDGNGALDEQAGDGIVAEKRRRYVMRVGCETADAGSVETLEALAL